MTSNYRAEEIFQLQFCQENPKFSPLDSIILLTFDDNYLDQSVNLMLSVAKYHPSGVSFVCTCPVLKESSIDILMGLPIGVQVKCYDFALDLEMGRWALSAVLRLFSPWLLSEDIHRVLYMDSDILCCGSLRELFDTNVPCIAMCNEISGNTGKYQQDVIRPILPTHIYCNSGVVLFNLDYLRQNHSFNEVFSELLRRNGVFHYLDQDLLNVYFRDNLLVLNAFHYNFQPHELKGTPFFKNALKNCRLIHFSVGKPWLYKSRLYLMRLYLKHSSYPPMIAKVKKTVAKRILYLPIATGRRMLSPIKQAILAARENR